MTYIIPGTAFVYQGTWYTAFNEVFASGCAVETAAVEVDEFEIAGIRAVSYTHLTLPTIYSV